MPKWTEAFAERTRLEREAALARRQALLEAEERAEKEREEIRIAEEKRVAEEEELRRVEVERLKVKKRNDRSSTTGGERTRKTDGTG